MSITTFENFLPEDLYEECIQTAESLLKSSQNMFTTNRHWDPDLVKDSYPVLVHMINPVSDLFFRLRNFIESKANVVLHDGSLMFYYWTRHSYITWHNDNLFKGGFTIYLNREWDCDFGGFFLYKDQDEIRGVIPKRNLALLQLGGIEHCTTPVNHNGDIRFTIQAFIKEEKSKQNN